MREVKFIPERYSLARGIRKYATANDIVSDDVGFKVMSVDFPSAPVVPPVVAPVVPPVVASVCPESMAYNLRADGSLDERDMRRTFNNMPLVFDLEVNGTVTSINATNSLSLRNDVLAAIAPFGYASELIRF